LQLSTALPGASPKREMAGATAILEHDLTQLPTDLLRHHLLDKRG
jgi:hypothetical protein